MRIARRVLLNIAEGAQHWAGATCTRESSILRYLRRHSARGTRRQQLFRPNLAAN